MNWEHLFKSLVVIGIYLISAMLLTIVVLVVFLVSEHLGLDFMVVAVLVWVTGTAFYYFKGERDCDGKL